VGVEEDPDILKSHRKVVINDMKHIFRGDYIRFRENTFFGPPYCRAL
jgi:hypothetical protein